MDSRCVGADLRRRYRYAQQRQHSPGCQIQSAAGGGHAGEVGDHPESQHRWRENSSPGPIAVGPGRQRLPHQGRRRHRRGESPPEDPRRDARPTSALRPTLLFHQEESQAAHRHLRRMTGRSWELGEAQLRTVVNGYMRGALDYCAAAWILAASPSHIEVIERELRALARMVTGCPSSTPTDALVAEAGMLPDGVRRGALATRMLGLASSLPPGDPQRVVSEARAPVRLTSVTGWRGVGRDALAASELGEVPFDPLRSHLGYRLHWGDARAGKKC